MPAVLQNVWLKIKKYKLPLLGAVLLLTLCLILAGNAHRRDHYQVQAVWQEENATLSVQETIRLTNRAGESLDHLCLRLYPNAFAEERSVPVPDNELSIAYPEGFASGGVSTLSVQVNGKNAPFVLEGAQRTVLRVQLPFSLRPQGGAEVTLRYDAALSRNRLRTGVLTKDVRLCNVLATLCIFQDGAFRTDDYTPIGDPFLSECADWDVELTAPGGYVAAGPGLVRAEDGRWIFRTRNQRDFALLLSKDYEVAQTEQNGICIRSFGGRRAAGAGHSRAGAAVVFRMVRRLSLSGFHGLRCGFLRRRHGIPCAGDSGSTPLYRAGRHAGIRRRARDGPSMVVCRRGQRPDHFPLAG